ncbi:hypothetical protein RCH10_004972 [Variovorax sp. GrIS 2.14]|jgi:hypothetical protein
MRAYDAYDAFDASISGVMAGNEFARSSPVIDPKWMPLVRIKEKRCLRALANGAPLARRLILAL